MQPARKVKQNSALHSTINQSQKKRKRDVENNMDSLKSSAEKCALNEKETRSVSINRGIRCVCVNGREFRVVSKRSTYIRFSKPKQILLANFTYFHEKHLK